MSNAMKIAAVATFGCLAGGLLGYGIGYVASCVGPGLGAPLKIAVVAIATLGGASLGYDVGALLKERL